MNYDLYIIEYPAEDIVIRAITDGVLYHQSNRLMRATGSRVTVLCRKNSLTGFDADKQGIILYKDNQIQFYDLEMHSQTGVLEIQVDYATAILGADFVVGQVKDELLLYCQHLDTKEVILGDEVNEVDTDGKCIYTSSYDLFSGEYKYTCYDSQLNEVWAYILDRKLHRYFLDFYLYGDTLIINGLYDEMPIPGQPKAFTEARNFELVALFKATGEVKWCCVLDHIPTYSVMIEDKFYLYRHGNLIVVDANDGKILLEHPVGYQYDSVEEERRDSISVFWHQDSYFVFSLYKGVSVFDKEMKLVQQIAWPKPVTPHCLHQFTCPWQVITGVGDSIYFKLSHYTGLGALAILTPTGEEPKIKIQSRPEFKHELVPETEGHAYKLITESDNLDEVVSCGEYELKEVAQYLGIDRSEHDHFDPELNDHLIFSVNKTRLPNDAKEDLKLMVERVEKFFETFMVKSAKTGKTFKVELEFR